MKKLRKILVTGLALVMGLTCFGCSGFGNSGSSNPDPVPVQPVLPDPDPDPNPNPNPEPNPDPDPTPKPPLCSRHSYGAWVKVDGKDVRVCSVCGNVEKKVTVSTQGTTATADMQKALNLSLLKKITMYNAGTINPISNYNRDMDLIEAMNAESLRIDLSIGKQNDDRNYTGGTFLVTGTDDDWQNYNYNFSQLDSIVNQISAKDVLPYLDWTYVPKPLQENPNDKTQGWKKINTSLPNWEEAWSQVYYNYAKHYVDKGIQIGYHEVLNEPDMFEGAGGMFMDKEQFESGLHNKLYELSSKAIRKADPDATIGGPAFAFANSNEKNNFLRYVKDNNAPLDFYSFHSYDGLGNLNYTTDLFARDEYKFDFLKTAFHMNEYSWLNGNYGEIFDKDNYFNTYKGAEKTLSAIMDVVERTDVQWVHWAQFMESTVYDDAYGLIYSNGHVKAAYNAVKMYNDMPVWRYDVAGLPSGVKGVFSANDTKMGYLIWNTNDSAQTITLKVNNPVFDIATRRVYRIDSSHGSYYENAKNEHLVAAGVGAVDLNKAVWSGQIPANGVVYITLNEDGYDDFRAWADRTTDFATDVKTTYYYWMRNVETQRVKEGTAGYSHFDRNSWTMYLSNGVSSDFGVAEASVIAKNLPEKFNVLFKTEGTLKHVDNNSALLFRIDFYDDKTNEYTYSVVFHNGLYDETRGSGWNWGTKQKPNKVVQFTGDVYNIDLSQYVPEGWNAKTGKAELSYVMQNAGDNTRAAIQLYK